MLDLSLGNLSDRGAGAAGHPRLAGLERLDIHHHYVSPALVERLQALGIQVDAGEPQVEDAEDPMTTATSPTRSSPPAFVVVGNPGCPRVAFFQEALARCGLPPAELVSYADLIAGRATLEQAVRRGPSCGWSRRAGTSRWKRPCSPPGPTSPTPDGPTRIGRERGEPARVRQGPHLVSRASGISASAPCSAASPSSSRAARRTDC